jgi:hypothetical protein
LMAMRKYQAYGRYLIVVGHNMRFIFTILFFKAILTFGQGTAVKPCQTIIDTLTKRTVYKAADKMASFPGGMEVFYKQINKRIVLHKSDNLKGGIKVFVAFVVQADGKVVGQRIIQNVKGTNLAEQFLNIIDDFKWEPGICNGKAISTIETYPMIIDIDWDGL